MMHVSEISLTNFRNFSNLKVKLAPGFNLILGRNARGKTNLLEAIFLLSTNKSPRTSAIKEVIKFNESASRVAAHSFIEERETFLELAITGAGARPLKINGLTFNRKREKTPIPTTLFSPDHLRLIKGSPEERREFLDLILNQVHPTYTYYRSLYYKILRERNAALQKVAGAKMSGDVIELFDEQLIAAGTVITQERAKLVQEINQFSMEAYEIMASGSLSLTYISQLMPTENIAKAFKDHLRERRPAELIRGVTLIGPHRDDLMVSLEGRDMRVYASQGEQRTACLALKFAEIGALERVFHVKPILLLDDVMSELDQHRRRALMSKVLGGGQALVSSTNREYFTGAELSVAEVLDLG